MRGCRRKVTCTFWCVVAASLFAAHRARADAPQEAKELFDRARSLRLGGDCAGALPLFRRTVEVYPAGLGSMRNIAECEEALGHFASARRTWLDLKHALLASSEPKYDSWAQDATQAAARLAPKVATLTIDVGAITPAGKEAPATGIQVTVNGERLSPDLVGTPLERDPGHYVVVAAGPAASAAQERDVELAPGDSRQVGLRVVVAAPPERDAPPSSARRATETAAWIAGGIGAAGFVGAGIAGIEFLSANSVRDSLQQSCAVPLSCNSQTLAQESEINDRGNKAATWVNVFLVAGAVGLSSGLVLYAIGRSRSPQSALVVSPAGISAVGRF